MTTLDRQLRSRPQPRIHAMGVLVSAVVCALVMTSASASAIGVCGTDDASRVGDVAPAAAPTSAPAAAPTSAPAAAPNSATATGPTHATAVATSIDASLVVLSEEKLSEDKPLEGSAEFAMDAGVGTELVESIVPCAFVESGAFGAFCADVSVYVMTDNGLVLCQVPMLAFEGDPAAERQFERRDASSSSVLQIGAHLTAMVNAAAALPPPQTLTLDPRQGAYAPLLRAADRTLGVPTSPC